MHTCTVKYSMYAAEGVVILLYAGYLMGDQ